MSFVQFWGDDSSSGATSGSNVTIGNIVCGIVFWNDTTNTLNSISNTRGPNLTLLANPTAMPVLGNRAALFYGQVTSSGSCTITPNFSSQPGVHDIVVHEYSGIDLASIIDNGGAAFAIQELSLGGAGTGTDAYTSGNFTTVTNGCTVAGFCMDPNVNNDFTAGTGFTARSTTQTTEVRADTEDKIQTSAGVIAATFTCANNFRVVVVGGLGLKPASADGIPGGRIYVT